MSLFIATIPQPGDNLDFSQGQLLANNQGLDTVFGVDHYKFSDATVNKGFHNKVTTPQFFLNSSIPPVYPTVIPVTTTNPVIYAYQPTDGSGTPTTTIGLIQYSRGPSNAVPTPITKLYGSAVLAPSGIVNIFDVTGISRVMLLVTVNDDQINKNNQFAYASFGPGGGGNWAINNFVGASAGTTLQIISSGNILQIINASPSMPSNNVNWAIEIMRIQ